MPTTGGADLPRLRTGSAGGAAGDTPCASPSARCSPSSPRSCAMPGAAPRASPSGRASAPLIGCWLLIRFQFEPLYRKIEEREQDLQRQSDRQEFGVRLGRALERSRTEADVLKVAMRAADTVDPQLPTEALIADSSRAHLRRAPVSAGDQRSTEVARGALPHLGCQVVSPWDCPAMSTLAGTPLPRHRRARHLPVPSRPRRHRRHPADGALPADDQPRPGRRRAAFGATGR